jgi:hypothetical protein
LSTMGTRSIQGCLLRIYWWRSQHQLGVCNHSPSFCYYTSLQFVWQLSSYEQPPYSSSFLSRCAFSSQTLTSYGALPAPCVEPPDARLFSHHRNAFIALSLFLVPLLLGLPFLLLLGFFRIIPTR